MLNYYYKDSLSQFLRKNDAEIIGEMTHNNQYASSIEQNQSWEDQILILKNALIGFTGDIFMEFSIPRMGRRIDTLLIIDDLIFVIEFKVGESEYRQHQIEQVWDYALDLKHFHKPSHSAIIIPTLLCTDAEYFQITFEQNSHHDDLYQPLRVNRYGLREAIFEARRLFYEGNNPIDGELFAAGSYMPTPTIIEAAVSLYNNHSVDEITRSDASAKNLTETTHAILEIIEDTKRNHKKSICFITGVPGAGKTLVGLKVSTLQLKQKEKGAAVYLSGNGPLVSILHEALTRDKYEREKEQGNSVKKGEIKESVKAFIQNIHHYRDAYLVDKKAPYDHIAIFDEAQRAWNLEKTADFMKRRKRIQHFTQSEPEFLISCLNRHNDWAVIICLVGGGQEINTGEAGISAWLTAIQNYYTEWEVHLSPHLIESEYAAEKAVDKLREYASIHFNPDLHLGVSIRSFRAEHLSEFIRHLLDLEIEDARITLQKFSDKYPVVLTRSLEKAKKWLREKARGSERFGLVVSSQAYRLKPLAIDVKSPMDPVHWFLEGKEDVRSSFFLEDVATEFHIQGLELDWVAVVWDGDLRYTTKGWDTYSFRGSRWERIKKDERKRYLLNAYRVLLTRARQGMILVIPEGNSDDQTRLPQFYDETYKYLKGLGMEHYDENSEKMKIVKSKKYRGSFLYR